MTTIYLVTISWNGDGDDGVGIASSVRFAKKLIEKHAITQWNAKRFEYNTQVNNRGQLECRAYQNESPRPIHYTIESYGLNEVKKRSWDRA